MSITPPKLPAHSSGGAWYDGGAGRSLAAIRWADRILLKHSIHVSTVCLLVFLGASQLLAQEEVRLYLHLQPEVARRSCFN